MKLRTVVILLLIIALGFGVYYGIQNSDKSIELLSNTGVEDIKTDLLQVKAKVKVIKEQSVVKDDEKLLKGQKLKGAKDVKVKFVTDSLKEKEIINEEEKNFKSYYLWDASVLQELNVDLHFEGNDSIVVNYETLEIILPNGVQLEKDGELVYKFSEME